MCFCRCYVGPNKSQWRKCADRYYPYGVPTQSITGNNHLTSGDHRPEISGDRPYPQKYQGDYGHHRPSAGFVPQAPPCCGEQIHHDGPDQIFLSPPSPGGFVQARYWPVAYLHSETPPSNVTYAPKPMNELPQNVNQKSNNTGTDSVNAVQTLADALKTNDLSDTMASTVGKRGSDTRVNKNKTDDVIEFEVVDNISVTTGDENAKLIDDSKEKQPTKNTTNKVRKSIRYW